MPRTIWARAGAPHRTLEAVRALYPLSLHGVGLSVGGAGPLDREHLKRLKHLIERYEPALFSEHLAWSSHEGVYLNDLLPLPYTAATLARVADHIDEVQETLGMRMLLENPSTYVAFAETEMSEIAFLGEVVRRTGCGLLLDVNNVFVQATNHGFEAEPISMRFRSSMWARCILAAMRRDSDADGAELLIDDHGRPVADPVWSLYARALARAGAKPTLIEWDNDVPDWPTLFAEAERADAIMAARRSNDAVHSRA